MAPANSLVSFLSLGLAQGPVSFPTKLDPVGLYWGSSAHGGFIMVQPYEPHGASIALPKQGLGMV